MTYYTAFHYAQAGNLVAMAAAAKLTGLFLEIIWKGKFSVSLFLTNVTAYIGLILLAQPNFIFCGYEAENAIIHTNTCPCLTVGNENNMEDIVQNTTLQGNTKSNNEYNCKEIELAIIDTERWYGYSLSFVAGLLFAAFYAIFEHLNETYDWQAVIFWNGLVGTIISMIAFVPSSKMWFPSHTFCLIFVCFHIIGAALHPVVTLPLANYLSPDNTMLIFNIAALFPFYGQSSFLSGFIPWSWNAFSWAGVVLIFTAFFMFPILNIIKRYLEAGDSEGITIQRQFKACLSMLYRTNEETCDETTMLRSSMKSTNAKTNS